MDSIPFVGVIKSTPEDFRVIEYMDFQLSGEGEHVWIYLRKRLLNTQDVQKSIARLAQVKRSDVGYSGLKDKIAVTEQWFSVYFPKGDEPDWLALNNDHIKIIHISRHDKKLRVGTHKYNFFSIIVKDCCFSNIDKLYLQLESIKNNGFLNIFASQRFGNNNRNYEKALKWITGNLKVKSQKDKGFLLSVLRSYIYNEYISYRKEKGLLHTVLLGDIVGFPGANSWFSIDKDNINDAQKRLEDGEIVIGGVLYGRAKKLHLKDEAKQLLDAIIFKFPWARELLNYGVESSFRAVSIVPSELNYSYNDQDKTLALSFSLPKGGYATALLAQISID